MITNDINNLAYVGYHIGNDLSERWRGHLQSVREGSKTHFHNAIRKYGKDKFHIIPVCSGHVLIAELRILEIYYIRCFNTRTPHGYNLTRGGVGVDSECMKRCWQDPDYITLMKLRPKTNSGQFKKGYLSTRKGGHRADLSIEIRKGIASKARKYDITVINCIRSLQAQGYTQSRISSITGVSQTRISEILHGKCLTYLAS
jgi:predicted XRE-type DNA-binding protein